MRRVIENKFPTIKFNGIDSKFYNIFVAKQPSVNFAEKNVEDKLVIGRNGSLTIDYNTYKDIEIPIDFIQYSYEIMPRNMTEIRKWLTTNIKDNKLFLPDSTENGIHSYFRVKYVKIGNYQRANSINKRLYKFNATFICEPFQYKNNGIILDIENRIIKNYIYDSSTIIPSMPIFKISGEGLIKLIVNGKEVNVNVGQKCIIDTKRKVCYKSDGTLINSDMQGNYEDLYFSFGENIITWQGNITDLEITEDMIIS